MSAMSPATMTSGMVKRRILDRVGNDPDRFAEDLGVDRDRDLRREDYARVAECLGIPIDVDEATKAGLLDAIARDLDRDHRVGVRYPDHSDYRAILVALREVER